MESWKDWFRQRFLLLKSKEWLTRDPFLREVSINAYAHSQFTVLSNSALVSELQIVLVACKLYVVTCNIIVFACFILFEKFVLGQ